MRSAMLWGSAVDSNGVMLKGVEFKIVEVEAVDFDVA